MSNSAAQAQATTSQIIATAAPDTPILGADQNWVSTRYGGADAEAIRAILCPVLIPMISLSKHTKIKNKSCVGTFTVSIQPAWEHLMVPGRTGKFVSSKYFAGESAWSELAKGRILQIDKRANVAHGEMYFGGLSKAAEILAALEHVNDGVYLEIDQYGASAKVLSALVEYSLLKRGLQGGFTVRRMPEDVAMHVGSYYSYDFEFEKAGVMKRVEVKSLWGTDTRFARLIHSKSNAGATSGKRKNPNDVYLTSSCKFSTQDIFAVSMFLRTGRIDDFAFARSVSNAHKPYGLPFSPSYPDYVNQNPVCDLGNGAWFPAIEDVWNLD